MNNQKQPRQRQVMIPLDTYRDLIHYFLIGDGDDAEWERREERIKEALRDKQEADERRLMYSAKLMREKMSAKKGATTNT